MTSITSISLAVSLAALAFKFFSALSSDSANTVTGNVAISINSEPAMQVVGVAFISRFPVFFLGWNTLGMH